LVAAAEEEEEVEDDTRLWKRLCAMGIRLQEEQTEARLRS
jgi:hypothetical protein